MTVPCDTVAPPAGAATHGADPTSYVMGLITNTASPTTLEPAPDQHR